jgi:hypothetical protein
MSYVGQHIYGLHSRRYEFFPNRESPQKTKLSVYNFIFFYNPSKAGINCIFLFFLGILMVFEGARYPSKIENNCMI